MSSQIEMEGMTMRYRFAQLKNEWNRVVKPHWKIRGSEAYEALKEDARRQSEATGKRQYEIPAAFTMSGRPVVVDF